MRECSRDKRGACGLTLRVALDPPAYQVGVPKHKALSLGLRSFPPRLLFLSHPPFPLSCM